MEITEQVAELILQLGIIAIAVRLGGRLAKKIKLPSVLGELLAGIVVGPFALGGIALPGFPLGIFPLDESNVLAVSTELYAFATFASIVLLFSSGLETNLGLFLKYSVAGLIIGFSGAMVSFVAGVFCGTLLIPDATSFMDPRCLFFGVIATTTSVGISARILSERKKMDSPEGVTILAASVFDDVLWIILLAVVIGIVALLTGQAEGAISAPRILGIAGRAFGIWLGVLAIGLICSKWIASFLKLFKSASTFSVLALGIALILAGFFEKQGLAMIIGAYVAGLSLSKTDIAEIIQERIRGIYEFFVPMFFAIMGMMVNVREIFSPPVLILSLVFTLAAVLAKVIGAGGSSLLLGFKIKGALRIGAGMIPRGEGALITAGIGLTIGVLNNQLFSASVLMILFTILVAPPLLSLMLKIPGQGTKKPVKDENSDQVTWEFETDEVADLVMDLLLKELRAEGFFTQMMNIDHGLSQARKDDTVLFITEKDRSVTIQTSKTDMPFVKNEIYEVILELSDSFLKLKASVNPAELKKNLLDGNARTSKDLLALIDPEFVTMDLKGETKQEIITELVDMLAAKDKLLDRNMVLADVLGREQAMGTGMEYGIALPHAKTDGVDYTTVAVGVKKSGTNFDSMDGQPTRIIILIISPKKSSGPHVQFLAAIGAVLHNEATREAIISATTAEEAVKIIRKR